MAVLNERKKREQKLLRQLQLQTHFKFNMKLIVVCMYKFRILF